MRIVDNVMFFDDYNSGKNGKACIGFSFALDLEKEMVLYSEECNPIVEKIANIIKSKSEKDRLISFSVYKSKQDFENIICREILGLNCRGYVMDTVCYEVPISLSEDDFLKISCFENVKYLVDRNIRRGDNMKVVKELRKDANLPVLEGVFERGNKLAIAFKNDNVICNVPSSDNLRDSYVVKNGTLYALAGKTVIVEKVVLSEEGVIAYIKPYNDDRTVAYFLYNDEGMIADRVVEASLN